MNTWRTVEVPAPEHTEGCSAGQCCCDEGLACCVLTEAAECVCGGVCTRLTDGDGMEDVDLVAGSGGDRAGGGSRPYDITQRAPTHHSLTPSVHPPDFFMNPRTNDFLFVV